MKKNHLFALRAALRTTLSEPQPRTHGIDDGNPSALLCIPPSAARNARLRTLRVAGPIVVLALLLVAPAAQAAIHYQRLASFGLSFPDLMGQTPLAPLIRARDGDLFGTTLHGGTNGWGTVFRLNRNGTGYRTLHHFGGDGDGVEPTAGLVEGSDGMLYGTTQSGGANNDGTIFKLNKDGSGYAAIVSNALPSTLSNRFLRAVRLP